MMNETYEECLVARKEPPYAMVVRALLGALTAITGFYAFMGGLELLGLLLFVGVLAISFYLFQSFRREYEYLYVAGILTIDKITAKARRKKVGEYRMEDIRMIVPSDSMQLKEFEAQVKAVEDYSSGNSLAKTYSVICQKGAQTSKVIIEPSQSMVHSFKMSAPQKVTE